MRDYTPSGFRWISAVTLWLVALGAASGSALLALLSLALWLRAPAPVARVDAAPSGKATADHEVDELRRLREEAWFGRTVDLPALSSRLLDAVIRSCAPDAAAIAIRRSEPERPLIESRGLTPHELEWLEAMLAAGNESEIVTRYVRESAEDSDRQIRTVLLVPLRDADGDAVGNVSAIWRTDLEQEADARLLELTRVVGIAAGSLENALRFDAIAALSVRDAGTGLLDRRYFDGQLADAVDRTQRNGGALGLLVVSVRGLGGLGERRGSAAADSVLAQIAHRLRALLPSSGEPCRLGGGELGLVLTDGQTAEVARTAVAELRALLNELEAGAGGSLACTGAFAELRPDDTPASLEERAEQAIRLTRVGDANGKLTLA